MSNFGSRPAEPGVYSLLLAANTPSWGTRDTCRSLVDLSGLKRQSTRFRFRSRYDLCKQSSLVIGYFSDFGSYSTILPTVKPRIQSVPSFPVLIVFSPLIPDVPYPFKKETLEESPQIASHMHYDLLVEDAKVNGSPDRHVSSSTLRTVSRSCLMRYGFLTNARTNS